MTDTQLVARVVHTLALRSAGVNGTNHVELRELVRRMFGLRLDEAEELCRRVGYRPERKVRQWK